MKGNPFGAGSNAEQASCCHRKGRESKDNKPPSDGNSVEPLPESSRPRKDGPGGE